MTKTCTKISGESGVALASVALFTVAVGLLLGAGLELYKRYETTRRIAETQDTLRHLQSAMIDYYAHNGRFPCPAPFDAAPDTGIFGREPTATPCANTPGIVRVGSVPVRSMNLPDAMMMDEFGQRIRYAVVEQMASAGASAVTTPDIIQIMDSNSLADNAMLVLLSHGGDERGAWNFSGVQAQACDILVISGENCDDDNVFINAPRSETDGNDNFIHYVTYVAGDRIGKQ